jgi:hypothetical protein
MAAGDYLETSSFNLKTSEIPTRAADTYKRRIITESVAKDEGGRVEG